MRINQHGFTIIELMIATAVFSVILIITTTTLIGVSETYIKGSVEGQTQQTARTVLSDISEDIQLNDPSSIDLSGLNPMCGGSPCTTDYFDFCIGSDVYAYRLDQVVTSGNWALVRYQGSCPGNSPPTSNPVGSQPQAEELLATNERLGGLSITNFTVNGKNAYAVQIEVGYGVNSAIGNSLLTDNTYPQWSPTPPRPVTPPQIGYGYFQYKYLCQSGLDSSFCSVSTLTTSISSRITD